MHRWALHTTVDWLEMIQILVWIPEKVCKIRKLHMFIVSCQYYSSVCCFCCLKCTLEIRNRSLCHWTQSSIDGNNSSMGWQSTRRPRRNVFEDIRTRQPAALLAWAQLQSLNWLCCTWMSDSVSAGTRHAQWRDQISCRRNSWSDTIVPVNMNNEHYSSCFRTNNN